MARPSKRAGRPRLVDEGDRTTIWLGKSHRRILAMRQRAGLLHRERVSQGDLIRKAIEMMGVPGGERELVDRLERELMAARAAAAQESAAREKAEKERDQALRAQGRRQTQMQGVLRHLPRVRELVAAGYEIPTGIPLLDQLWENRGRRWAAVLERLETPPPGPPSPSEAKP